MGYIFWGKRIEGREFGGWEGVSRAVGDVLKERSLAVYLLGLMQMMIKGRMINDLNTCKDHTIVAS